MIGLPHAKENGMLSRFNTIPERDRQYRQTDGRTDRENSYIKSRVIIAVLTRDKTRCAWENRKAVVESVKAGI